MKNAVPDELQKVLDRYAQEIRNIYGTNLKAIILYGSYARGDFRPDSDVDIMILVSMNDDAIADSMDRLYGVSYDFWWEYEVDINPVVKNETHFRNWTENYPFYSNISREGVRIYAA